MTLSRLAIVILLCILALAFAKPLIVVGEELGVSLPRGRWVSPIDILFLVALSVLAARVLLAQGPPPPTRPRNR